MKCIQEEPVIKFMMFLIPSMEVNWFPMYVLNPVYFEQFDNADDLCTDCRNKGLYEYDLFDCECDLITEEFVK